jgi:hypothetical protein
LHDSIIGERLGIPAVGVMTTHFISAAELMGRVLGAEGHPFAVIEHPISSATVEELREKARHAVEQSVAIFSGRVGR